MIEGKCVNPECPATEVWVLDTDDQCNTCGRAMIWQDAPMQKFADPMRQPNPADVNKGA